MARIPLEDNFVDVLNKAQRGLGITDEQLTHRAKVSAAELASLKAGEFDEAVARRVSRHLRLQAEAFVQLAKKTFAPTTPPFRTGFTVFNTPMEDMTVNNYLIWDERSGHAAAFDTGATAEPMLELIASERLRLQYIFLTHTHEDHIADLPRLAEKTGAEVWASNREPVNFAGAKSFAENVTFHLGPFAIRTLFTWGHSPGGATYYVTGLSYPLAIVGDSLFAGSMGGAPAVSYADAVANNRTKILSLPTDTVLACGHGPLTTVKQEKKGNPFFAY